MYAQVLLDIPSKELNECFDYLVPQGLLAQLSGDKALGSLVLVPFGARLALGYVLSVSDKPQTKHSSASAQPAGSQPVGSQSAGSQSTTAQSTGSPSTTAIQYKEIQELLVQNLFTSEGLAAARWMARHYAAALSTCIALFCPPGGRPKLKKDPQSGRWTIKSQEASAKECSYLSITQEGRSQLEKALIDKRAYRQKKLLETLLEGPLRKAELSLAHNNAASSIKALIDKGYVHEEKRRSYRHVGDETRLSSATAPSFSYDELSSGQKAALHAIEQASTQAQILGKGAQAQVVLLDGVTGSGKTEVYLQAIERCLNNDQGAVVLVPEISLTPQTVGRFRSRFGDKVAVLHSRLSIGERYDQWDSIRSGQARIVVGARSALFAPLKNPGIYIIDEEHESSYKQSSSPRYHARDLAEKLASLYGVPLVLGSATPSLESLYACELRENWKLVSMPERSNKQALPSVELIDMAAEFASGKRSMFSRRLQEELRSCLKNKYKALLLLNRRGFSYFFLCRDCGYVPRCQHCSSSLTYHRDDNSMHCHSCGARYPLLERCPRCGSVYLKRFGAGIQRVEAELQSLLDELLGPGHDVPVIRMDADTCSKKGAHARVLEEFDSAESAVLLGTQMVAKGLDFPELSLVGIIDADSSLKLPDFRAAEKSFALFEQVAGRAGRASIPGKVLVQTYNPDEPILQALKKHDAKAFREAEFEERKLGHFPPFSKLIRVVFSGDKQEEVKRACFKLASDFHVNLFAFDPQLGGEKEGLKILGPSSCLIEKLKDKYRWHVIFCLDSTQNVDKFLEHLTEKTNKLKGKIHCIIDVDPYELW